MNGLPLKPASMQPLQYWAYGYGRPRLAPPPSQENAPDWGEPLRLVVPGDDDFDLPDIQLSKQPAAAGSPSQARETGREGNARETASAKAAANATGASGQGQAASRRPWEREQEAGSVIQSGLACPPKRGSALRKRRRIKPNTRPGCTPA